MIFPDGAAKPVSKLIRAQRYDFFSDIKGFEFAYAVVNKARNEVLRAPGLEIHSAYRELNLQISRGETPS